MQEQKKLEVQNLTYVDYHISASSDTGLPREVIMGNFQYGGVDFEFNNFLKPARGEDEILARALTNCEGVIGMTSLGNVWVGSADATFCDLVTGKNSLMSSLSYELGEDGVNSRDNFVAEQAAKQISVDVIDMDDGKAVAEVWVKNYGKIGEIESEYDKDGSVYNEIFVPEGFPQGDCFDEYFSNELSCVIYDDLQKEVTRELDISKALDTNECSAPAKEDLER